MLIYILSNIVHKLLHNNKKIICQKIKNNNYVSVFHSKLVVTNDLDKLALHKINKRQHITAFNHALNLEAESV